LPIADLKYEPRPIPSIGNWQSQIGNKKVPLNNAGLQKYFEVFRVRFRAPELFSWLFYVAASRLNSPRLSSVLIRCVRSVCQAVDLIRTRGEDLQSSVLFLTSRWTVPSDRPIQPNQISTSFSRTYRQKMR